MPNYWLLKTEPSVYSFTNLQRDGQTAWDGVANALALRHLRAMAVGDCAFIYHSGDERQIVGIAEITRAAYADSKANDPKLVVVDLKSLASLAKPVSLATIKARPEFTDFALVRISRLSVMPVTAQQWKLLCTMAI